MGGLVSYHKHFRQVAVSLTVVAYVAHHSTALCLIGISEAESGCSNPLKALMCFVSYFLNIKIIER